jgi:uncharacterized protein
LCKWIELKGRRLEYRGRPFLMSRIQNAYDAKLRPLLRAAKARQMEKGLRWLANRAHELEVTEGKTFGQALERIWQGIRRRVELRRPAAPGPGMTRSAPPSPVPPPRFLCDAGLGGLARWLRAAGYEAQWRPDISDEALLDQAQPLGACVLTTDSLLMERRLLRDGVIPSLWLSPALTPGEQLQAVLDELHLPVREPRCMHCGGELAVADKEAVRDRIPPRTYRWLDEYFVCGGCGQLFWRGTHWQRIQKQLQACTKS